MYLESYDGGFITAQHQLATVGVLALFALPSIAGELLRLPSLARFWFLAWSVGLLSSVWLATVRTDFIRPLLIFGIVTVSAPATLRIWRRSWGPRMLLSLLAIAFSIYFFDAATGWWGGEAGAGTIFWAPLSWHNQSSILMGAMATFFAGVAVVEKGITRYLTGLLSVMGLSGAWLAGSRGGILFTAVGLAVVGVLAIGKAGRRRVVAALGILAVGALFFTGGLLRWRSPGDGGSGSTLSATSRTDPLATTTTLRLYHIEAALKMFIDRPIQGQGLGAYAEAAPQYSRPIARLTAFAHNEYAQIAGEGGLLLAVPTAVLMIAAMRRIARAARHSLRSTKERSDGDATSETFGDKRGYQEELPLREGLACGAGGAAVALALHAGIDFDWAFAVLAALLAMALAVVFAALPANAAPPTPAASCRGGNRRNETASGPGSRVLVAATIVAIGLAPATGVAADTAERLLASGNRNSENPSLPPTAPWDATSMASMALQFSKAGDFDRASKTIEEALWWNPGVADLKTAAEIVRLREGKATSADVIATLEMGRSSFRSFNLVAEEFLERGDFASARKVLDETFEYYSAYPAWFSSGDAVQSWTLLVRLEGATGGCASALKASEAAKKDARIAPGLLQEKLDPVVAGFCAGADGRTESPQ